jgi:hypothetical protein
MRYPAIGLLALVAIAPTANSQQLYKCGNTYSQTPCAADAKPRRLHQGAAPERAPGESGFELCAAAGRSAVATPEPESARGQPLGQRVSEVIQYAGQPLSAHRYDLTVDAKSQYGVFSGPVAYSCWLSEDQARVLQFVRRRPQ